MQALSKWSSDQGLSLCLRGGTGLVGRSTRKKNRMDPSWCSIYRMTEGLGADQSHQAQEAQTKQ